MLYQLQEIMGRLDFVESELRTEKKEHKEDVERLNAKIDSLTQENTLLRNDNARLRSIINNDSSNSSLSSSTDHKGGKPANTYNGRTKSGRKAGGHTGNRKICYEIRCRSQSRNRCNGSTYLCWWTGKIQHTAAMWYVVNRRCKHFRKTLYFSGNAHLQKYNICGWLICGEWIIADVAIKKVVLHAMG